MKPLYDALCEYSRKASAVFHMPGHKLGQGFESDCAFLNPALIDVTELDVTDDLYSPGGPLLEAQELAAQAFGAGRTWFLVNGSSCGIFAMIAANCGAGQKLLIARDFHYSAFNAMCFARAEPVYIPVEGGVLDPASVERALFEHPDASAVYLTRPGYYGDVCDIAQITRLAHKRGIPVLVDEAHGAHLSFSARLPAGALEGGADYCVQSAHKTLPAFTQCAYAHVSPERLSIDGDGAERFSAALRALQTSSPSFILTASLDYAREYMSERGAAELDRILDNCESFYADMAGLGYGIPHNIHRRAGSQTELPTGSQTELSTGSRTGSPTCHAAAYDRDMTRLVLSTRPVGLSGFETERLLWSQYGIKIEMADPSNIVMITTVADKDGDFALLKTALMQISSGQTPAPAPDNPAVPAAAGQATAPDSTEVPVATGRATATAPKIGGTPPNSVCGAPPIKACAAPPDFIANLHALKPLISLDFITNLHAPKLLIPLDSAENHIAAEIVAPYPPGIPLLCPGEIITGSILNEIRQLLRAGAYIKGIRADNPAIAVFRSARR